MKSLRPGSLLLLLSVLPVLHGCAPVVVGGAAGAAVVHDRRSAGTVLDDQIIELKCVERINQHDALLNQAHINYTAYNGIVLLTGEAPTSELKQQANNLVSTIPGVRKIHDEVIIAAPSSVLTRSSDSWITAKVKTNLFNIRNIEGFDPTHTKVVTENGTVFLMGLLTRKEADAVTDIARQVDGVQRVVRIFEYVD